MSTQPVSKTISVPKVVAQKGKAPLTMLTAYDYPIAKIIDESGVDMILVGDSLGTVIYGEPNTLSVTMDKMLMHTIAVTNAAKRALVVADLPFMSYQVSTTQAVTNAGKLIQEGKAGAVKLEGGCEMEETVRAITRAGIPVMGHIGLTPQSIHAIGNYRMFGKTDSEAQNLIASAKALENAGAFAIVLECINPNLAEQITKLISIPTIGIGSGIHCDGQVLVSYDLLGLTGNHVPKFVKQQCNLKEIASVGINKFVEDVTLSFPKQGIQNVVSH